MNKKTGIGALVAILVVIAGAVGFQIPAPVATMLQQAGIEIPASLVSSANGNSSKASQPGITRSEVSHSVSDNKKMARDFREAKRWLYVIHDDQRTDFYCGCGYDKTRRKINTSECGYKVKEDKTRGHRIEAEHVIPASWLGKPRACWDMPNCRGSNGEQLNGRDCCLATDAAFRTAHNDLINLMPTVGELNKHRGSYPFGEVRGEPRAYGQCNFEVANRGPVEPPDSVKGDIARIAFYMQERYSADIRGSQMQMFRQWDKQDPVSEWERERNRRVEARQGVGNHFVAAP